MATIQSSIRIGIDLTMNTLFDKSLGNNQIFHNFFYLDNYLKFKMFMLFHVILNPIIWDEFIGFNVEIA